MRVRLVALIALLFADEALASPRLRLLPEIEVGAGLNDNLFLNPTLTGTTGAGAVSDALLHLAPRISALLSKSEHRVSLEYGLEWHHPLSGDYGTILDHLSILEYRSPLVGLLLLRAAALVERYDATFTSGGGGAISNFDAFWLGGGELGAHLLFHRSRAGITYRGAARSYPNRAQSDREHRLSLSYDFQPLPRLSVGAGYGFTSLASDEPIVDGLLRHRVSLPVRFDRATVAIRVEPFFARQSLPRFTATASRNDTLIGLSAQAVVRLHDRFELFGRYDLLHASSDDPTGRYGRNQLVAGLAAYTQLAFGEVEESPPGETAKASSLAPTRLGDGRTRFRLRANGARSVAVIGDWNGWSAAEGRMEPIPGEEGLFELAAPVPPGRYGYVFWVDGETVLPPDAEAYVSDGFGGKSAVLTVHP